MRAKVSLISWKFKRKFCWADVNRVAVYLHWPFCLSKCPYCDFVSYPNLLADMSGDEVLLLEDLRKSMKTLEVESIGSVFFGGGTPSLMSAQSIDNIIEFLRPKLVTNAEISLEANPSTFDKQKLLDFRMAGINRLSLGIQSFREKNLKFLGRIYSADQAQNAAELVAKIFGNFSFDFMYGYQPINEIESDLQTATRYGVRHISCYQLTLEQGTPFFARFSREPKVLDDICDYMPAIEKFLSSKGLYRYEISNFAKPKYESKHNLTYWNYGNYLGCGPGAHSRIIVGGQKHATTKCSNLKRWREKIGQWDTDIVLSYKDQLEEMILTGLRKISGIKISELFQQIPEQIVRKIITQDKLNFLRKCKLIEPQDDKIQLTAEGLMKINSVIEKIVAT